MTLQLLLIAVDIDILPRNIRISSTEFLILAAELTSKIPWNLLFLAYSRMPVWWSRILANSLCENSRISRLSFLSVQRTRWTCQRYSFWYTLTCWSSTNWKYRSHLFSCILYIFVKPWFTFMGATYWGWRLIWHYSTPNCTRFGAWKERRLIQAYNWT
jgi:hypothetical protein